MAIHVHKHDDIGAPNISSESTGNRLIALLYAVLVSGYDTHSGYGWQVIFDDSNYSTGTDGKIVLKHPSHSIYFVFTDVGSGQIESGMAEGAGSDGSVIGYQSGNKTDNGDPQGFKEAGSSEYDYWYFVYDDVSGTAVIQTAAPWQSTISNKSSDDTFQRVFYIGTLATVSDLSPFGINGVGHVSGISREDAGNFFNFVTQREWTTIKTWDGGPADGTQTLETFGDVNYQELKGTSIKGIITRLQPFWIKENTVPVGRLRGIYRVDEFKAQEWGKFVTAHAPTVDQTIEPSAIDAVISIGTNQYKLIRTEFGGVLVVSLQPEEWANL